MDRELLIELGVEELPASWLPPLTRQLAEVTDAQVKLQRLAADAQAEAYSHAAPAGGARGAARRAADRPRGTA